MKNLGRRQWVDIFFHRSAAITVFLVMLHQGVIASSSYFLIKLIQAFEANENYDSYLLFYLLAMTFPYLPGSASFVALQAWTNRAHSRYTLRMAEASFGMTDKYRDKKLQENVESVVARNSFTVIREYLDFVHWFMDFLLNSVLSILVLGFLLPGNLLMGYFASLILCAAILLVLKSTVARYSRRTEDNLIEYGSILSKTWENATLGNSYNYAVWQARRDLFARAYYNSANRLIIFKQLGSFLLAFASLGPTVYLVIQAMLSRSLEAGLVAAIVVNLTRIFHILSSLSALVYQLLDWSSMNARLRVLFDVEQSLMQETTLPAAAIGRLHLNGTLVEDFASVLAMLKERSHGRFTVRGANGSGKSTLLQALKKALAKDAVYIPAHQGGLSWRTDCPTLSTGQKMLAQLREISLVGEIKFLLLDEWDANLDRANTECSDRALDEISKRRVVVEVRH
jgi:ABC-type bacteriocin/lantibiotic exporter with double-glycine peptidase domain